MRKITAILTLLLLVGLTGCGSEPNDQSATVSSLENKVKELENKTATSSTGSPTTPATASPGTTPGTARTTGTTTPHVDYAQRNDELSKMSYEECQMTDQYRYLGLTAPKQASDGSSFYYDCKTHIWGWFFQGSDTDKWVPKPITREQVGTHFTVRLPLEALGAPDTLRHPKHSDALTLAELKVGDQVCVRDNQPDGETATYTVYGLYTIAVHLAPEPIWGYPALQYLPDSQTQTNSATGEVTGYLSLENTGVVPYPNGLWSSLYIAKGPC